ncbi:MAG: hypothetical protein H6591_09210 [Flavobacteriales bacterium]|nr:hypothetical protein [Flavobacteriales bacterium]
MKRNGQHDERFGDTAAYMAALRRVLDGATPKQLEMLLEHYRSPEHTNSWEGLAQRVGYRNRNPVQLQYGKFAERLASELGVSEKPEGFWLYVLAKWADEKDDIGHTRFTMRRPLVESIRALRLQA